MTPYRTLIEQAATELGLDPNLVEAVVITESSGQTDAFRYEPGFYTAYIKGKAEYANAIPRRVASSYGLMQVMYTTATQYGFGLIPELLFVPATGLRFGCLHLAKLLKWSEGDVRKALAAYNGGQGNWRAAQPQQYVSKVLKALDTVKAARS